MAGWGTIPWGTGPWGFGIYADLFIADCFVLNERMLRVILSRPPQATSPIAAHDALNPTVWTIYNPSTQKYLKVLGAAMTGERTVDLYTLEKFSSYLVDHEVSAPTLWSASGTPIVLPYSDTFLGVVAKKLAPTKQGEVDIANPQFQSDHSIGGTWEISSSGDYSKESGTPYLRKLIVRRLTTGQGEFFHLDDYGLGLNVKGPLTTSDMIRLKGIVERQLGREPDFAAVRATLALNTNGVLTINIRVRIQPGNEEVNIPIKVPVRT